MPPKPAAQPTQPLEQTEQPEPAEQPQPDPPASDQQASSEPTDISTVEPGWYDEPDDHPLRGYLTGQLVERALHPIQRQGPDRWTKKPEIITQDQWTQTPGRDWLASYDPYIVVLHEPQWHPVDSTGTIWQSTLGYHGLYTAMVALAEEKVPEEATLHTVELFCLIEGTVQAQVAFCIQHLNQALGGLSKQTPPDPLQPILGCTYTWIGEEVLGSSEGIRRPADPGCSTALGQVLVHWAV